MMRFRSHPLIEASITYVITGALSIISLLVITSANVAEVVGLAQVQAMFVLLPAFFLWLIGGFILKNYRYKVRFAGSVAVTLVVTLAAIALFAQVLDALPASEDRGVYLNLRVIPIIGSFAIGSIIAALICQFWLIHRSED